MAGMQDLIFHLNYVPNNCFIFLQGNNIADCFSSLWTRVLVTVRWKIRSLQAIDMPDLTLPAHSCQQLSAHYGT